MGVPKFYYWLSQRYPSINENINRLNMPEFDYFYVDMNGVFHTCSHPSDDVQFRLSEAEIFQNISVYIEFLFNLIQPRKVFFLSVDGVAPRSKMNQQRTRRFKTAKEAIEREAKARQMGETIPSDPRFDSNCITPGTEFMHSLHNYLIKFLSEKVQHNNAWKNVEVIYSGYDVPGEGEHKIMDYIRYCRTQNKFIPDAKHCLYGLDADLIHLGLCSHEPYFSLLREKVVFSKNQKRHCDPFKTDFQLLHLSILRNYIYNEFCDLKDKMKIEFNIEKIIDDWILINFSIGNDFLPHVPKFHILKGGIQILYDTYKEVIVHMDGYINQDGQLNLKRYKVFLEKLAQQDVMLYDPNSDNSKYFNDNFNSETFGDNANDLEFEMPFEMENDITEMEDDSDSEVDEFLMHKNNYYKTKLHFKDLNLEVLQMANEYVKGIQWVLHYYYNGCVSWSWYYPYYYGPFVTDLAKFDTSFEFNFHLNEPFLPLVQLLSVIPQASHQILPHAFQKLTYDSDSPLIDFFPKEVTVDLNEKIHDYEALILIPFVDEKLFLKAFHDNKHNLTPTETERNKYGHHISLMFTEAVEDSSHGNIEYENVTTKKYAHDFFILPPEIIFKGLRKNVDLNAVTGFPSLVGIDYKVKFENTRQGMYSYPCMILQVQNKQYFCDQLQLLAKRYIGKLVYVDWPLLSEAKLLELFDKENRYTFNDKREVHVHPLSQNELQNVETMTRSYCNTLTRSKGIKLEEVSAVGKVVPLQSQYYQINSGKVILLKEWSNTPMYVPLDVMLYEIKSYRKIQQHFTFSNVFTKGKTYFLIDQPFYGYKATVIDYDKTKNLVHAKVCITSEPDFDEIKDNCDYIIDENYIYEYKMINKIRHKLNVADVCIKRLLGSVLIEYKASGGKERRLNIGLKLKYKSNAKLNIKPYCIPGYSMEDHNEIYYSHKVLSLFEEYYKKFPFIFEMFSNVSKPIFSLDDAIPDDAMSKNEKVKKLTELKNWLSSLDIAKIGHFKSSADYLDNCIVKAIEETIESHNVLMSEEKIFQEYLSPSNFYIPESVIKGNMLPDSRVKFYLFDRVVNIKGCMSVPYGAKGTVVGIYKANDELAKQETEPEESINNDYVSQLMSTEIEVLFDEPFDGGQAFRSSKNCIFKMHPAWLINITYGLANSKKTANFRNVYQSIQFPNKDKSQQQMRVKSTCQGSYSKAVVNKVPTPNKQIPNQFNHSETSPFKILTKNVVNFNSKQQIPKSSKVSPKKSNIDLSKILPPKEIIAPEKSIKNLLPKFSNCLTINNATDSTDEAEISVMPPAEWINNIKPKREVNKSNPKTNFKLGNLPLPSFAPMAISTKASENNTKIGLNSDSSPCEQINSQMYIIPTLTTDSQTVKPESKNNQANYNKAIATRQFYNSNYRPRMVHNNNNQNNYNYDVPLHNQNSDVKRFVPLQVARNFQHERNVKLKNTNIAK